MLTSSLVLQGGQRISRINPLLMNEVMVFIPLVVGYADKLDQTTSLHRSLTLLPFSRHRKR